MRILSVRVLVVLLVVLLVVVAGLPDGTFWAHANDDPDAPPVGIRPPRDGDMIVRLPREELVPLAVALTDDEVELTDWGHAVLDVPSAWKVARGKGVRVAVLDTGCDCDHPDLKAAVVLSKDFTGSRSGCVDVQGHGTHCTGIVGARANGVGMIGVAPECEVIAAKVLNDQGWGTDTDIAAGIAWAVEQRADIISLSLGSRQRSPRIADAVAAAQRAGVLVVAAAGNEGPRDGTVGYPGALPGVVCVAAVGPKLDVAGFSSRGPSVVVAAPGVGVRSAYPGGRQAALSGTSMSTPYVAGCAALALSAARARGDKIRPADLAARICATARDLAPAGHDTASGCGLIQPLALAGSPAAPMPRPAPGAEWRIDIPADLAGRKVRRIVVEFEEP